MTVLQALEKAGDEIMAVRVRVLLKLIYIYK